MLLPIFPRVFDRTGKPPFPFPSGLPRPSCTAPPDAFVDRSFLFHPEPPLRASSSFSLCDLLLLAFYISGFLLAPCAPASTLLLLFIRLFFSIPFCILSPLRFISLGAFISLYLFLFLFLLFVLHSPCIRAFTFRIISFIIFPFLQPSCCLCRCYFSFSFYVSFCLRFTSSRSSQLLCFLRHFSTHRISFNMRTRCMEEASIRRASENILFTSRLSRFFEFH